MSDSLSSEFENLYEVRKTIRFNLLPVNYDYKKISDEKFESDLKSFLKNYKQIIKNFSQLVFTQDENKEQILNRNTKISLSWLKTYVKQDFHANRKNLVKRKNNGQKTNTYVSLRDTLFLLEIFQNWVEKNWNEENEEKIMGILNRLEELENKSPESKGRKADFSYLIYQIRRRTNFEFAYEFFKNSQGMQDDVLIEETIPLFSKCENLLENLENYLLPSQSLGKTIEQGSFNYHTVNKNPKNYPEEVQKLESQKNKANPFPINDCLNFLNEEIKNLNDEYFLETDFSGKKKLEKKWDSLKLQYAYKFLKEYKAEQKSRFFNLVLQQKMQTTIMQEVPLFDFSDSKGTVTKTKQEQFQNFYNRCFAIQEKSTEYEQSKDQKIKTEITHLKKQRGKDYFDVQSDKCPFQRYRTLCELFKKVAMECGKIKAEVKSLEKEQIDAERLQLWAILLEKENQHYIMTIPRDRKIQVEQKEEYQLPHVYRKVKQLKDSESSDWNLYYFESLTLRALEKLCFGTNKNTFVNNKELLQELRKFSQFFNEGKLKRKDQLVEQKSDDTWNENMLIDFYQTILSCEATKKMILIEEYLRNKTNICEEKFTTLKDFQVALEKQCYIRKKIQISHQKKEELEKKYGANLYQITSYDLFEDRKNQEGHTKLWNSFWSQDEKSGYAVRLNPEFKINYVEKREDSIKNKAGEEVKRNRKKQEEYILSLSISENNDKPKFDMAFAEKEKIKMNIENFNKELNKKMEQNPYNFYYYGIDRGNEELLTLGIFKFENQNISFTHPSTKEQGSYKKPIPVDLEIWELPENKLLKQVPYETKNGTKYTEAYKNISYADKEGLLEKNMVQSCLDITRAKMIGNKLVINGDVATLMNLKLENAKRKIIEEINLLIKTKTNKKGIKMAKIEHKQKSKKKAEHLELNITLEDGNTTAFPLYWLDSTFEKNKIQPELETILKEILESISKQGYVSVNVPIVKINHLRDAICANAVGIITHLQQKYFGFLFFEDLEIEKKNEHFSQNNTNLGSRIEFALLRKFQTLGFTPPNYKMVMSMQSKKEINQLGLITYIKTEGTSSNCPHCGQKIDEMTKKENKWEHHQFRCCNNGSSCGFNTYSQEEVSKNNLNFQADKKGLDFLNTSDDVASYNIAKRGLEFIIQQNNK